MAYVTEIHSNNRNHFTTGPIETDRNPLSARSSKNVDQIVTEKVRQVYYYSAAAFAATVVSAFAFAKIGFTAAILSVSMSNPVLSSLALSAIGISLLWTTIRAPRDELGQKQMLFGTFAVWQGLVLSPLVLFNAPAFAAASCTTVAVTGGLGVMAMSLKENFEKYEKILMVALCALAFLSFTSLFLSVEALALAHEISYVGGFALFSAFLIYDTHKARRDALNPDFDPINHSVSIYLDVLNIFIRLFEMHSKSEKK